MQSVQCNPIANPCICTIAITVTIVTMAMTATAIIIVIKALGAMINMVIQDQYSYGGHNAYGVMTV